MQRGYTYVGFVLESLENNPVCVASGFLSENFNNIATCINIIYVLLISSTMSSSFIYVDWRLP